MLNETAAQFFYPAKPISLA